jgi:hypothetical protein
VTNCSIAWLYFITFVDFDWGNFAAVSGPVSSGTCFLVHPCIVNLYGGEIFIQVHHDEFYYFGEFSRIDKNTHD